MSFPLRTRMLAAAGLAALALAVGACGNEDDPYAEPTPSVSKSAASDRVGDCPVTSPALRTAKVVAAVDLDGDGQADQVKLTGADGPCPNLVFADTSAGMLAAQVPNDGPPVTTVQGFGLGANAPQLLVTRQEHPRGGFQVRLWSSDGSRLRELTDADGHSLVPFVATDVKEQPVSIDCAGDRLVVTTAVPHTPMGVMFAWDVRRTTYRVDDGRARVMDTAEIADNVRPDQLRKRYPALAGQQFFKSCTPA